MVVSHISLYAFISQALPKCTEAQLNQLIRARDSIYRSFQFLVESQSATTMSREQPNSTPLFHPAGPTPTSLHHTAASSMEDPSHFPLHNSAEMPSLQPPSTIYYKKRKMTSKQEVERKKIKQVNG